MLIVFNLLNQSAHKRYITMNIDDINGDTTILAMNRRQLRLHRHFRHRRPSSVSSLGINRKRKSECSASHRHSINSGRVYTDAEIQERIDRNNFRRGRLSATSGYLTLRNYSHRFSSSDSNSTFPKHVDGMTMIRF